MRLRWYIVSAVFVSIMAGQVGGQEPAWKAKLRKTLPLLGHRNWIVVVDSAYPLQTSPGIDTIYTGERQLDVVRQVLEAVERAPHVRGKVFVDAELKYVPEELAAGITAYRKQLHTMLKAKDVTSLKHEEILVQLSEAGETFKVIVLKTQMTLPYTSVFIRLDAGYWSDEAEAKLREAMADDH